MQCCRRLLISAFNHRDWYFHICGKILEPKPHLTSPAFPPPLPSSTPPARPPSFANASPDPPPTLSPPWFPLRCSSTRPHPWSSLLRSPAPAALSAYNPAAAPTPSSQGQACFHPHAALHHVYLRIFSEPSMLRRFRFSSLSLPIAASIERLPNHPGWLRWRSRSRRGCSCLFHRCLTGWDRRRQTWLCGLYLCLRRSARFLSRRGRLGNLFCFPENSRAKTLESSEEHGFLSAGHWGHEGKPRRRVWRRRAVDWGWPGSRPSEGLCLEHLGRQREARERWT